MRLRVVKIGASMFDALHAYGLALLVAAATGAAVAVEDDGAWYSIHTSVARTIRADAGLLADVLALPTPDDLRTVAWRAASTPLTCATMDGLLAALLTQKGVRLLSLHDLIVGRVANPTVVENGLAKVRKALERWTAHVRWQGSPSGAWIAGILSAYGGTQLQIPQVVSAGRGTDIGIALTLDPALGFSTRRPTSDGWTSDKTSVALRTPQDAGVLAYAGAARFLRAQHVGAGWSVLYVPLATSLIVTGDTALPLLRGCDYPAHRAIAAQAVTYARRPDRPGEHWSGLAFQIVQRTRGAHQSITRDRGYLDLAWLVALAERGGSPLLFRWQRLLRQERVKEGACALAATDALVDCLLGRRTDAWMRHLRETTLSYQNERRAGDDPPPGYALSDVQGVTDAMIGSTPSSTALSDVLRRPGGTRRFGHALRQLGQYRPSTLYEIVGDLDAARTGDALNRILARVAQECALTSATIPFMIVPNDDDLAALLDDVDHHTAPTIAGLLIVMSSLRFPRTGEARGDDGAVAPSRGAASLTTRTQADDEEASHVDERP